MPPLDPDTALQVLMQLDEELGEVDPDTRAIVGLRHAEHGTVGLLDVTLEDNGVLVAPDDAQGLVVVTSEEVADGEQVLGLHQLLCVLRSGIEVGVYRTLEGNELQTWRTDADPDDAADDLRPRDLASNTARRAFGLPSLTTPVPMTDLLARAWLLRVASEALQHFDGPDGLQDVGPEVLAEVASTPPIGGLPDHDGERADNAGAPTFDAVHAAAIAGTLEVGPFRVDEVHAAWLDAGGLAQVLDQTLPDIEQLLATLSTVGDDDLLSWAIEWLVERNWYDPR